MERQGGAELAALPLRRGEEMKREGSRRLAEEVWGRRMRGAEQGFPVAGLEAEVAIATQVQTSLLM